MSTDITYKVTWPNESFITVISAENSENADFTISYQYNDRDPQEVIEAMTPEERAAYYETTAVYDTE